MIVLRVEMVDGFRVALEIGPKGKKSVALAPDWPGLERGGKTGEVAIDRLRSYVPRYATVAKLAGRDAEFAAIALATEDVDIIEEYRGNRLDRLLGHLVRLLGVRPAGHVR